MESLRIASFNVKGFKDRNYNMIRELFNICDILCVQETWLYNFQHKTIGKVLPNSIYYATSSMDETNIDRVGRPYGGCAIIFHKSLNFVIKNLNTSSGRLCAVTASNSTNNYLIFSVYMPVDNGSDSSYQDMGDILAEISAIAQLHDSYQIIIAGDLNIDFKRNSQNKNLLDTFLLDECVKCISNEYNHEVEFTFESADGNRSFIDHFIISENLMQEVTGYKVLFHGCNLSDHHPLITEFKQMKDSFKFPSNKNKNNNDLTLDWEGATEAQINHYKFVLNQLLQNVPIPAEVLQCKDNKCTEHSDTIIL